MPPDLSGMENIFFVFFVVFALISARYLIIAGAAFIWINLLIKRPFEAKQVRSELLYSLISSLIFALVTIVWFIAIDEGYTRVYFDYFRYPWWWGAVGPALVMLIHEIYFYLTHRWMHHPKLFKRVHLTHHLSVRPTSWASFCFHPYEALTHAIFLPLVSVVIPLHPLPILAYLSFMTLSAVSNHSGVELLPFKRLRRHVISGTHHAHHHKNMNVNFGLYFTWIDRICNTHSMKED